MLKIFAPLFTTAQMMKTAGFSAMQIRNKGNKASPFKEDPWRAAADSEPVLVMSSMLVEFLANRMTWAICQGLQFHEYLARRAGGITKESCEADCLKLERLLTSPAEVRSGALVWWL